MTSVVGGVYLERCLKPEWDQLYGSGGRAAAFLAGQGDQVCLYAYLVPQLHRQLEALSAACGFRSILTPATQSIRFHYTHCLARPRINPDLAAIRREMPLQVEDTVVLRFGMLEGEAQVRAGYAVYDPQSAFIPQRFRANGSTADHLAIVANRREVAALSGLTDPRAGARALLADEGAEVVVVKQGTDGALVVTAQHEEQISAYHSELVWTIGSGDCFAAAFTQAWAIDGLDPVQAADSASRAVAQYSHTRSLQGHMSSRERLQERMEPVLGRPGKVYLAGPFFTLAERWLVEEARDHLQDMGMAVFSPVHDVGYGAGVEVAPLDLQGLDTCDRVLALLPGGDPGTIFEIGYAVSKKIPVVAYTEHVPDEHLKMLQGTGCRLTDDFVTAIHHTCWLPPA
jgi:nucleoside 2-deoxyribosyltransferase